MLQRLLNAWAALTTAPHRSPQAQLANLRRMVSGDYRWLGHNKVADALTERYLAALAADWYTRVHADPSTFRSHIGLEPAYHRSPKLSAVPPVRKEPQAQPARPTQAAPPSFTASPTPEPAPAPGLVYEAVGDPAPRVAHPWPSSSHDITSGGGGDFAGGGASASWDSGCSSTSDSSSSSSDSGSSDCSSSTYSD